VKSPYSDIATSNPQASTVPVTEHTVASGDRVADSGPGPRRPGAQRRGAQDASPSQVLASGLEALKIPLTAQVQATLMEFLHLLERWNGTYNLTRIDNPTSMVQLHLLDSLTALPYVRGRRVLDVGTGAGMPGIVLAAALPECEFVLLDAVAKKVRFCQHVIATLGLKNVQAVHGRAQAHQPSDRYDTVVARALATLVTLVEWTRHLAGPNTRLLALKGRAPSVEVEELGAMGQNAALIRVHIPGLSVERHIVTIDRLGQLP
jgi:16S rRNA (guanine527-N7)-methyltransferase